MTLYGPSQMFEHAMVAMKGWSDAAALDFAAPLSANVTFVVPRGRVVHVNAVGQFEMGVGETDMAIFLLNGQADFDVSNPGMSSGGVFMHQPIMPVGIMSGLVATGAYELNTSEYDSGQTYVPGDLLSAGANNTDITKGGVVTNQKQTGGELHQYVDPICGVVSRGVFANEHGINVLAFWPVWLPGAFA
jgi:hypothetical protein